jgi:CubicO group peptidase (beta-lactamase class C family)
MEFQTAENWVDYILGRQQVAQPGAVFNYSTGNTHLLAAAPTGAPPPPYGPAQYDTYMAFGAWGQFIIVVPELELVTVITSQGPQGGFVPRPYFTDYILAACQPGDEDGI